MKPSFLELSNILKDTERIPGGYRTDCCIANWCHINENSRVLIIGDIATAITLCRIYRCKFDIVDIDETKCTDFRDWIEKESLSDYIKVSCLNVTDFKSPDEIYDIAIVGNVLSLVSDYPKALKKIVSALKNGGRFVATPMYVPNNCEYEKRNIVNAEEFKRVFNEFSLEKWKKEFASFSLVLRIQQHYKYKKVSIDDIEAFSNFICQRAISLGADKHLIQKLAYDYRGHLTDICKNNENLHYSILIYTKELINCEPELFFGEELV